MSEWSEIIIRSILFVITLFLITKLGGKKQLAELSFFEYVSGITIGSIAGEVIMGLDGNMFHGVLAILIFGGVTYLGDVISIRSKKFRDLVEGKATVFIKDGKILEDNLKKEKFSIDELQSLLRQKDVFKTADVEFAVLEPKGDISVLLKKEVQPLTAKDVNLKIVAENEPQTVIMDGKILYDPLTTAGKSKQWLQLELEKLGVTVENVFFAQIDSFGELSIDTYDDQIKIPSNHSRPLLLAMMKKCQSDLELFAFEAQTKETMDVYKKNAMKIQQAIDKATPFLKQ